MRRLVTHGLGDESIDLLALRRFEQDGWHPYEVTPESDQTKPNASTTPPAQIQEPSQLTVILIGAVLAAVSLLLAWLLNFWFGKDQRAIWGDNGLSWISLGFAAFSLGLFLFDNPEAPREQVSTKWYKSLGWKRPTAAFLAFLAAVQPLADIFLPEEWPTLPLRFWPFLGILLSAVFGILYCLYRSLQAIQKNIEEQDERGTTRLARQP